MNKRFLGYCLIYLLAGQSALHAQYLAKLSQCVTNPPDFSKLSYEEADRAIYAEETKPVCSEYITNLVRQLQLGHLSDDNKTLVIYLLKVFRPTETNAIEILIANIDFKAPRIDPAWHAVRWGQYPAAEALASIGNPVVTSLLAHLAGETNELRRYLMCGVLINVDGKNGEHYSETEGKKIAQGQIDDKLAHESDPAKRLDLDAAMQEVEKWKYRGVTRDSWLKHAQP